MAENKKTQMKKNNTGTKKTSPSTSKSTAVKKSSSTKTTTSKKATTSKKSAPKSTTKTTKSTSVKENKKVNTDNLVEAKKESKEVKVIEINQRRLIMVITIVILIVILCLICFFGSNSVSKDYQKSSNTTEQSSGEEGSGDNILEQATKEAGEISDDIRTSPTEISVSEYIDLYHGEELSLVLLSKESCSYCQIAVPIIENIIYESGVKINHVDVGNMSSDDTSKLIGSDDYFSEGYGTPLLMVVGNNSIKDKIEGLTTKANYQEFFRKYGFME